MKKSKFILRSDLEKARASALASLCMREHSVKEIIDKLTHKGYQLDSIEIVVTEYLQDNYLNDKRFAEIYWRVRARKGFGENKIAVELKQKGIASELIQQSSIQDELDFAHVIQTVYAKKFKDVPIKDFKDKAKRQNYLYQRGFNNAAIRKILENSQNGN